MLQAVPFQCSTRVWNVPASLAYVPTAHTSLAETASTFYSSVSCSASVELGTTLQLGRQVGVAVGVSSTTARTPLGAEAFAPAANIPLTATPHSKSNPRVRTNRFIDNLLLHQ